MKSQIVSFHCVLKNQAGKVISSTYNCDVTTWVEGGALLRGLAEGLHDLRKGEKRRICLPASKAYGFYDPQLVIEVSRKKIGNPPDLRPGTEILSQSEGGENRIFRVVSIHADRVILDGNHPLAGQDLVFDIETTEAREASAEELAEWSHARRVREFH